MNVPERMDDLIVFGVIEDDGGAAEPAAAADRSAGGRWGADHQPDGGVDMTVEVADRAKQEGKPA